MAVISVDGSNTGIVSGGSNSSQTQVAVIMKQIAQLTKQLINLRNDTTLKPEEKLKQQELIQNQIKMLQDQLAQVQKDAADKAKGKFEVVAPKGHEKRADGINRPTSENAVNLYI